MYSMEVQRGRAFDWMLRQTEDKSDLKVESKQEKNGNEALLCLYDCLLKRLFDKDWLLGRKIDETGKLVSEAKAESRARKRELRRYMDAALERGSFCRRTMMRFRRNGVKTERRREEVCKWRL